MTPLSHCQTGSQPTTVVSLHRPGDEKTKDFSLIALSLSYSLVLFVMYRMNLFIRDGHKTLNPQKVHKSY